MKRYSVVPHGSGASHMPSEFTDSLRDAMAIYTRMLANGANTVLVWDEVYGVFIHAKVTACFYS